MHMTKKHELFMNSDEGKEFVEALTKMAKDEIYHTGSTYSSNATLHPDNIISFVDKHIEYVLTHPGVNPIHYVSNLRLMTRKR